MDFSDIVTNPNVTSNDFLSVFDNDERAKKHSNYYHYTKLDVLNKILKNKQIFLGSTKMWNDKTDIKPDYCFSVCFATGTSESLPLWYLYSGIDGRGARLGFSKKTFISWIESCSFSLLEVDDDYNPTKTVAVLESNDYEMKCRDILYLGMDTANKGLYRAKYNGKTKNRITKDVYEEIKKEYRDYIKSLIWFYEKETRIFLKIKNEKLKKAIANDKKYVVAMDISDVISDLRIMLAPEFGEITLESFSTYEGIKDWMLKQIEKSDFAGECEMKLKDKMCKECQKKSKDGQKK